jgi:acetoin utilization protein AcuB
MDIKDLMTRNVVTIPATATCAKAVETMFHHRVRHLPVVDAGGKLCGIVTDRDLRHHLFEPQVLEDIGTTPVEDLLRAIAVSEVMSVPVVTVGPTASLETAARLMLEDKVGSLPVVDGGRVVGIITETDLLRRIVGEDAACRDDVREIVISFP